jgi:small subunit ribosomal protein S11
MLVKAKNLTNINIIALINIYSSSNNTIINISNIQHKTLLCGSTGILGLKGGGKSTFYAGEEIGGIFSKKLLLLGIRYVLVKLKGLRFNRSRYSTIKGVSTTDLKILKLEDITPIPFNGCKPQKKRRI